MRFLIPLILLLSGCTTLDHAETGQLADVGTTAVGIVEFGMVEANPVGYFALPLKWIVNDQAEMMVAKECNQVKKALSTAGWGAAGANLTTIAMSAFGPASLAVGAVSGVIAFNLYEPSEGCTETDLLAAFEKRWQQAKRNEIAFQEMTE